MATVVERSRELFESGLYLAETVLSDLLGCDISTPAGQAVFEADNLVKTRCLDITVKTTDLVMQVLENHDNIRHSLVE